MTAAIVGGSVLTFAYSARFVIGLLGRCAEHESADEEHPMVTVSDHNPPTRLFATPGFVLAIFSLIAGLAPVLVDDIVHAATLALHPESHPSPVKLWAGFNIAFWLSVVVIASGGCSSLHGTRLRNSRTPFITRSRCFRLLTARSGLSSPALSRMRNALLVSFRPGPCRYSGLSFCWSLRALQRSLRCEQ